MARGAGLGEAHPCEGKLVTFASWGTGSTGASRCTAGYATDCHFFLGMVFCVIEYEAVGCFWRYFSVAFPALSSS